MKKLSKIAALALAAALSVSLAACGSGSASPSPSASAPAPSASQPAESAPAAGEKYVVGICQLAPHVALDAATQGFKDAIEEALPGQVEFKDGNAAGDSPTCATIVNGFVSDGVDLIMANATPALQAAASATGDIPVLGTSVTEYGVALGIDGFTGTVRHQCVRHLRPCPPGPAGRHDQGAGSPTPRPSACSTALPSPTASTRWMWSRPSWKSWATPAPSIAFSDTNDMASVTQNAADHSEILYVPTDNTAANNAGIVDNICHGKLPVFTGEEGICAGCGVATLSISYYDLGVATGKMAVKILTGESNVSEMPIEYAPQFTKKFNEAICADLGLTPPDGYEVISAE